MRRRALWCWTVALFLLACGPPDSPMEPHASMSYGPDGTAGLYFDFAGNTTELRREVGETFSLYVIAFGLDHDPVRSTFAISACGNSAVRLVGQLVYPHPSGQDAAPNWVTEFDLRHGNGLDAGRANHLMRIDLKLIAPAESLRFLLHHSELHPNSHACEGPGILYSYMDGDLSRVACAPRADETGAVLNPGN